MLSHGLIPQLREITSRYTVPQSRLPQLLTAIEDALRYEHGSPAQTDELGDEIRSWRDELLPKDLSGRVSASVGKNPWHYLRDDVSSVPSEITSLASELMDDSSKLEDLLDYLNSPDAVSGGLLGDALARLDQTGQFFNQILASALRGTSLAFVRGYIARIVVDSPDRQLPLNCWLDEHEAQAPEIVHLVSLAAPASSKPLERVLRLIAGKKISAHMLHTFLAGALLDPLTDTELLAILQSLIAAGDPPSLHIAVDFVAHFYHLKARWPQSPEANTAMWTVLRSSARIQDQADYWWARIVQQAAEIVPEAACGAALIALEGSDFHKQNEAWSILASIAKARPDLVMEELGRLFLNSDSGWRLRAMARSGLFEQLPVENVKSWLEKTGLEGARAIANHLQGPFLSADGKPQLSPVTEAVMSRWGADQTVFNRFVAATHHLQMYSGDIAAQHREEAARARPFLSHPIAAIRRWADYEIARGDEQARQWNITMEEQGL